MSLLDLPRCPNCNSAIDLKDFWSIAPKRGMSLSEPLGIVCPVCGVKLRVLGGGVPLIGVLPFILAFGIAILFWPLIPSGTETEVVKLALLISWLAILGGLVLQKRFISRLLRLQFVRDGEDVNYPLVVMAEELKAE